MKRPQQLSETMIRNLAREGRYTDKRTPGLSLLVRRTANGRWSKTWCQRIKIDGKVVSLGLGSYPRVSLEMARHKATVNRVRVAEGEPIIPKAKVPTFEEATERYYQVRSVHKDTDSSYERSWVPIMRKHALPRLGRLPVDAVTARDVLRVLKPIWNDLHFTAKLVRQRIRKVLDWCQGEEYVSENVADDRINAVLRPRRARPSHHKAMPYQEVPAVLAALDRCSEPLTAKLCLKFLILTAARSGEARGARWSEVDRDQREWWRPKERMKGRKEHRQPLSEPTLEVLTQAVALKDGSDLVFPSPLSPGKELSDQALRDLLAALNLAKQGTVHGFRSSFTVWADECTDFDPAVVERALAHEVGTKTEQAYARSDLFDLRLDLLEAWGRYACGSVSVTPEATGETDE